MEKCYTCKEKFENKYLENEKYQKVRDHCPYTGKYIGPAPDKCNLKYSVPKTFPYLFIIDLIMINTLS